VIQMFEMAFRSAVSFSLIIAFNSS
jgi:hypothetical protein